jgi:hypothetical protein
MNLDSSIVFEVIWKQIFQRRKSNFEPVTTKFCWRGKEPLLYKKSCTHIVVNLLPPVITKSHEMYARDSLNCPSLQNLFYQFEAAAWNFVKVI